MIDDARAESDKQHTQPTTERRLPKWTDPNPKPPNPNSLVGSPSEAGGGAPSFRRTFVLAHDDLWRLNGWGALWDVRTLWPAGYTRGGRRIISTTGGNC